MTADEARERAARELLESINKYLTHASRGTTLGFLLSPQELIEASLSAEYERGLADAERAVRGERLDDCTLEPGDIGYEAALDHALKAISALRAKPTTGGGGGR